MKNKGITFLLLIVVGIIWYQVFFRIKSNLSDEPSGLPTPSSKALRIKFQKDTFALQANYRDPFKAKSTTTAPIETSTNDFPPVNFTPPKPIPEPPKPHRWPKMNYYGVMKSTSQKGNLAIIAIDNMLFNLREGEEAYDRLVVKKIYGDSVLVVQGKNTKILRK